MLKIILTNKPKVSVLLPIYNAEAFLREAVESILAQTFSDFELLAINDGSTDHSREILTSFSDSRLKIIDNDGNRGLIYTLNRGIEHAKGEFIARMDADDIALPERLALQIRFLDENPNVALVGGQTELIDSYSKSFKLCQLPQTHDEIITKIFTANCFVHPSVLFRANVIRNLGGYREEALHAEDYDLWLRIIEHYDVANLAEILVRYRIHSNQVSLRKLCIQRAIADKVRFAAFERCKLKGRVSTSIIVARISIWQRLWGKVPSAGADYIDWIDTYHLMGRDDLAQQLVLKAIIVAPLCKQLYLEFFRPITHAHVVRVFLNRLHWYRKKVWLLINRRFL
jgi:glycosyltransferase involved in cell wall biosynthesis